jgi:PBSX family phage terminase large subunit
MVAHRYRPRGACRDLLTMKHPEVLLSGPAGTGKSRACLEKLLLCMLKYPTSRGLILRKTQVSLSSTALVTWREHVATEFLATKAVNYYGGSSEEPPQYRFTNGSRIMIGGMDNPTKVMSSEYDMIYVQEAIELGVEDWEHANSRLRNGRMPYQQLLADTNPWTPEHWLNRRCERGSCTMVHSRHTDNPVLYDDAGNLTERGKAYMAILDRLTGPRRSRLRDGLWVAAEGQIYDGYDPAVHVVAPFEIPSSWPRVWGIDFGYTNPFTCQFWAIDPDGRMFLYREIYFTRRLVEEHAVKIMECVSTADPDYVHTLPGRRRAYHGRVWTEPKPIAIVCDHDAEGRGTLSTELGLSTRAAVKRVKDGIQETQSMMKPAGDGRARLYLFADALVERDQELVRAAKPTCLAEEIPGYVWANKSTKEEPSKIDDHGCDTMRYVVMNRAKPTGSGVRTLG